MFHLFAQPHPKSLQPSLINQSAPSLSDLASSSSSVTNSSYTAKSGAKVQETIDRQSEYRSNLKKGILDQLGTAHTVRSYASLPLTMQSVQLLQHDERLSRRLGPRAGAIASWQLAGKPQAMSSHVACMAASGVLLPAAAILPILPVFVGAATGAAVGLNTGLQPNRIRTHGLYYTGVFATKQQAKKVLTLSAQYCYDESTMSFDNERLKNLPQKLLSIPGSNINESQAFETQLYLSYFEMTTKGPLLKNWP